MRVDQEIAISEQNTVNRETITPIADIRGIISTIDLDYSVTTARGQGTLRISSTNFMDSHRIPSSIREEELLEMCVIK